MSGDTYELRFGDIDFSPAAQVDDIEYRVLTGLRRGRPVPVTVVAESMIQDGQIERVDRHDNRDMAVVIGVKAADSALLADAESALFLEAQKERNELAWTPPDGYGETTVFDVLWCDLAPNEDDRWDLDELRGFRFYTLSVRALPFGRSVNEVVTTALASGAVPSSTVISDGTSATNWTGTATVTSSGGWLQQTVSSTIVGFGSGVWLYDSTAEWTYTPGSPLDFSSEVYLTFDFDPPNSGGRGAWINYATTKLYADGVEQLRVSVDQPTTSVYRVTFLVTDTSAAVLKLVTGAQTESVSYPGPSMTHKIDAVTKSNQAPNASTTGRESLRTVEVKGSARTQGRLAVEHASTALGTTLIYTYPGLSSASLGYQPSVARWKSAGSPTTSDSSTMSGGRTTLTSGGATFNIPAAALPRGSYLLVGRLRMNNATARTGKLSLIAGTRSGGTLYGSTALTSPTLSLEGSGGSFKLLTLGTLTLPPTDVASGSAATVELGTFAWSGSDNVVYDDLFLFYLGDNAALTWVDSGTMTRLWLDPASLDSYLPSVYFGTQSDRSDAIHAGGSTIAWGVHSFAPPLVKVFVATTTATNPDVTLGHYPAWHTHAAAVD